MADTTTVNYGWTKPENNGSDDTWGLKLNTDLDSIDATVKAVSNAAVAAQADATTGVGRKLHLQLITASGNFAIPAGAVAATVFKFTVCGGGGAGGGATTNPNGGGGGGSGRSVVAVLRGFTAAQNVALVIGAGGAGSSGASGGAGGTTTLAYAAVTVVSCPGGTGGAVNNGTAVATYGQVGIAATVAVGASGLTLDATYDAGSQDGQIGPSGNWAGAGGGNAIGVGGAKLSTNVGATTTGNAGTLGGGGGGGIDFGSNATGGSGGAGFVLVEWVL